jgi:cell division protein FtsB
VSATTTTSTSRAGRAGPARRSSRTESGRRSSRTESDRRASRAEGHRAGRAVGHRAARAYGRFWSRAERRRRASHVDPRRGRRITGRALALIVVVGALLFAAMYPLRAYLGERSKITSLEQQVAELRHQNGGFEHRIAQLRDPAYLEALARNCLGMVKAGEIPFVVVPKQGSAPSSGC